MTVTERPAPPPAAASPPDGAGGGAGPRHHRIAIVGTGFAGLGMAIRLAEAGIDDVVVLERASEVGGTWRDNHYPGCACDVPSHLYSFSFAPNPDWTNTYSPQPEIEAYLQRCAERHGVRDRILWGAEVLEARWDEAGQRWHLATPVGEVTADVVISGNGPLSEPNVPALPGIERFEGTAFHSAAWDHDHDLTGRKVAVIGTGASAIQFVPQIQPRVEQLTVFQRTPPWVMPHPARDVSERERRLYRRVPLAQKAVRAGVYWARELFVLGFRHPRVMALAEKAARDHLRKQVPDPELRARLTPDHSIGCKRILPSNRWLPALSQPNVDVETSGVTEVRERSIVTGEGREVEVDTLIYGTGFHVTDNPFAERVRGVGGRTLAEAWDGGVQAYVGSTVAGFPNLFLLIGPNTGLGHSSMVFMIESQITYVLDALRRMERDGIGRVEVRGEAVEAYNDEIQSRLEGTVWMSGCASWYLDDTGRNTTLWPGFTWQFRLRTRRFDAEAYDLAPARRPAVVADG
ncbi:MAG TPA: NAD(P)/FAD-dependent oxidoreductase [Acidimicrobiales bacterium]|nr:NAD(P)/FAD-dependent oxidoreductase [Acidimicrobiales bacterium]